MTTETTRLADCSTGAVVRIGSSTPFIVTGYMNSSGKTVILSNGETELRVPSDTLVHLIAPNLAALVCDARMGERVRLDLKKMVGSNYDTHGLDYTGILSNRLAKLRDLVQEVVNEEPLNRCADEGVHCVFCGAETQEWPHPKPGTQHTGDCWITRARTLLARTEEVRP